MKFEENWPRGNREVVQKCDRTYDERTDDGRTTTDDGRQMIIITHPEPCSGELKIAVSFSKPTPIFSDVLVEIKVAWKSIVRVFLKKNMSMKLTKINKSGELNRLLTFGCLVSHGRKFAYGF